MTGKWSALGLVTTLLGISLSLGCDSGGGGGGGSSDVGDNDPGIVVALGDSITAGTGTSVPFPSRVAGIVGKTVVNAGTPGLRASEGAGRVGGLLAKHKPGYLLILLGTNDAIHGGDVDAVMGALGAIIAAAKANKTIPIIANLPPMYDSHSLFNGAVDAYNPRISSLASEMGARFVNLSGEFGSSRDLIGGDGLHPNDAGQDVIAVSFAGRI